MSGITQDETGIHFGKQGFYDAVVTDNCVFGADLQLHHRGCNAHADGWVIWSMNAYLMGFPIQVPQPMCSRHLKIAEDANRHWLAQHPGFRDPGAIYQPGGGLIYNLLHRERS